jgi:hypothetical protein
MRARIAPTGWLRLTALSGFGTKHPTGCLDKFINNWHQPKIVAIYGP